MRIRSIKPEFWTSEDVAQLDWPTRLLFIGLWSYVDDNGVGRDNTKLIKADLFPLEDDPRETLATVSRGLQHLSEGGQITRYTVDGKAFLFINAWTEHQRIDRPNKSRYPSPCSENSVIRETLARPSRDPRETPLPGAGEQRSRGTEEQRNTHSSKTRTSATTADAVAVREASPPFHLFWDAYGKKVGRGAAHKAWTRALKRADGGTIIAAALEHADWHRAAKTESRFIPHPTTWLNEDRWTDERGTPEQQRRADGDIDWDAAFARAQARDETNAG